MPIPTLHRALTLLVLPVCLLVFAACDSDDPEPDPVDQTIAELAQDTPDLSILVQALQEADLVSTLNGAGPFTVFAPSNAAFEALLADLGVTADELLARDDLAEILTYHVVPAAALSTDLSDGQMLPTAEGGMLEVDINGNTISLIGETNTVTVTAANIEASNGVVHIIDGVLLPGDDEPSQDIVELAQATPALSTLVTALSEAGLVSTLQGDGPFTVFAPVNEAFADLPDGVLEALLDDANEEVLQKVLTYHVVPGRILAEDLVDGQTITTVEGSELTIDLDGGATVNGVAITDTDILASNGVVHLIGGVLTQNLDIPEVATVRGFDTLVAALAAAELVDALEADGPFTVFAPTEQAFADLLAELEVTAEELLARDDLDDILLYHVVAGEAFAADLTDGQELETLGGGTLTVDISGGTVSLVGANNTVTVVVPDVDASNGVIHAIDAVLLP
jgi:transforming growth factor-beta-induced protein